MSEGNDSWDGAIQPAWLEQNKRQQVRQRTPEGKQLVFGSEHHVPQPLMPQTNKFPLFFRIELLELCFLYSLPRSPVLMALALFFKQNQKLLSEEMVPAARTSPTEAGTEQSHGCDRIPGSPSVSCAGWCRLGVLLLHPSLPALHKSADEHSACTTLISQSQRWQRGTVYK